MALQSAEDFIGLFVLQRPSRKRPTPLPWGAIEGRPLDRRSASLKTTPRLAQSVTFDSGPNVARQVANRAAVVQPDFANRAKLSELSPPQASSSEHWPAQRGDTSV